MTPLESYREALNDPSFIYDSAQENAVECLDRLHRELERRQGPARGWLSRLRRRRCTHQQVPGLYLWGGVGRGKTHLMDLFYDGLPCSNKLRLHFHRFMQLVHGELGSLRGRRDPLVEVARRMAERARVLCLDEMQVNDITDAMIMGGLLEQLFHRGVTVVTTSNSEPDQLYRNGLQRDRFLPAIDLIKQHTAVLELASPTDYRLRRLEQAEVYHWPLDDSTRAGLAKKYRDAVAVEHRKPNYIVINDRQIPVVQWTDGVVWFDFDVICNIPRSQLDHVEIARYFHTVLLQNVRMLNDAKADMVLRFVSLVDAFYDRNVKLLISAEAPPEKLYSGQSLAREFERTLSRLHEIQSHAYLARPHLA